MDTIFILMTWSLNLNSIQLSFAPVFQWCCSTPQGTRSQHVVSVESSCLFHHSIIVCDLFVSRDDLLILF